MKDFGLFFKNEKSSNNRRERRNSSVKGDIKDMRKKIRILGGAIYEGDEKKWMNRIK